MLLRRFTGYRKLFKEEINLISGKITNVDYEDWYKRKRVKVMGPFLTKLVSVGLSRESPFRLDRYKKRHLRRWMRKWKFGIRHLL